jgi:undecaprenyl-diphosphatase
MHEEMIRKFFSVPFLPFFICLSVSQIFPAETVFQLSANRELEIIGTGAALWGGASLTDLLTDAPSWDGTRKDIAAVNLMDRFLARPYTYSLDVAGSVVLAAVCTVPAAAAFLQKESTMTVITMGLETVLLTEGVKRTLNVVFPRYRPYVYFDDPPDSSLYAQSWPSGHTIHAFAMASFSSYVFNVCYPDSVLRGPFTAACFTGAAAVGVLRVLSGNHFVTDVLAGAVLGTIIGVTVPALHFMGSKNRDAPDVILTPVSLVIRISG